MKAANPSIPSQESRRPKPARHRLPELEISTQEFGLTVTCCRQNRSSDSWNKKSSQGFQRVDHLILGLSFCASDWQLGTHLRALRVHCSGDTLPNQTWRRSKLWNEGMACFQQVLLESCLSLISIKAKSEEQKGGKKKGLRWRGR